MDNQKRVFVTQIPHRTDPSTGAFVPSLNINSCSEFGEIEIMAPPRGGFFDAHELHNLVSEKFHDFDNDTDCILPLGDPVFCAACCAFLGQTFNYFDVLRWDKSLGRYTKNRVIV